MKKRTKTFQSTLGLIFYYIYFIIHSSLPHSFIKLCLWILLEESYYNIWIQFDVFGGH